MLKRCRDVNKCLPAIITGLMAVLCGCTQYPANEECLVFENCIEVNLDEVSIQGDLNGPAFLRIFDDRVFISDYYSEHVFHVYSGLDYQFEGSLIRRETQAENNNRISMNFRLSGPDTILYREDDLIHIAYIHADNGGLTLSDVFKIELPQELTSKSDFFIVNDTLLTSNVGQDALVDFQGLCLISSTVFDHGKTMVSKTPKQKTLFSLGVKYTAVNPDKSAIATIYSATPALRIYSTSGWELTKEFIMGELSAEGPIQYFSIRSTSDYIYALFTNTQPPSLIWDGEKWRNPDVSNEIHIWDWDGNPIKELRLNRSIYSFDVSPDNARLVAMSAVDVNHLFVAEIPWD